MAWRINFMLAVLQGGDAATSLGFGSDQHISRTHGAMDPACRRMLGQRAPLPVRGFEIAAGLKIRAADSDHAVESEAVVGSEIERNLEPFDGRCGIAIVYIDPSAAAPRPGRAAVDRKRLADHLIRCVEVVQEGASITENSKHGRVCGEILRLSSQFGASRAILVRRLAEILNNALSI